MMRVVGHGDCWRCGFEGRTLVEDPMIPDKIGVCVCCATVRHIVRADYSDWYGRKQP